MSRLFLEDGESIPVTAVSVCGNYIADIKTIEKMVTMQLQFGRAINLEIYKNENQNFLRKLIQK